MDWRKEIAEDIVDNVIALLNGRAGFDNWWGSIDPDTQNEIVVELTESVEKELWATGI